MAMKPGEKHAPRQALDVEQYDEQWRRLRDFSRYNPGVRHRRRMILDLVSELDVQSVVDVGCGAGHLLESISQSRPELKITGVDLSPEVISKNARSTKEIAFHVFDLADGPLPQRFDLVICSEVIEHLDSWRLGVRHLADMVGVSGYLLLTCPTGPIYDTESSFGHVEHPEKQALRAEVESNGFRTVSLWQWGFPMYRVLKAATNVNAEQIMESFGSGDYTSWQRFVSTAAYWGTMASLRDHPLGCQLVGLFQRV